MRPNVKTVEEMRSARMGRQLMQQLLVVEQEDDEDVNQRQKMMVLGQQTEVSVALQRLRIR